MKKVHTFAACCIASSVASTAISQVQLRAVAVEGKPILGTSGDVPTTLSSNSIITNLGYVGFSGYAPTQHAWFGLPGSSLLSIVAGTPMPGGTATLSILGSPQVGAGDEFVFAARLDGPGVTTNNKDTLWRWSARAQSLVARTGDSAPGTDAEFRLLLPRNTMNRTKSVGFYAQLLGDDVDASNQDGVWVATSGLIELVARAGDVAPGTGGALYRDFSIPLVTDSKRIAFRAFLQAPAAEDQGVWIGSGNSATPLFREGGVAPYAASQYRFGPMNGAFEINDSGDVFFSTLLQATAQNEEFGNAVWRGKNAATLHAVAARMQPAPGTAALFSTPIGCDLNDSGELVFTSDLTDATGTSELGFGLWVNDGTNNRLIVRDGMSASGSTIHSIQRDSIRMSNDHSVVFGAHLLDDAGVPSDHNGVFSTSTTGDALQLLVRSGDSLEVAPGEFRTVGATVLNGISDQGSALIRIVFTDDSEGIYVATIPEPTLLPPCISIVGLVMRRSRKRPHLFTGNTAN